MFGRKLLAIFAQKEDRRAEREDPMVAERRRYRVGSCRPERDSSFQLRVSVSDDQQVLVTIFGLFEMDLICEWRRILTAVLLGRA